MFVMSETEASILFMDCHEESVAPPRADCFFHNKKAKPVCSAESP